MRKKIKVIIGIGLLVVGFGVALNVVTSNWEIKIDEKHAAATESQATSEEIPVSKPEVESSSSTQETVNNETQINAASLPADLDRPNDGSQNKELTEKIQQKLNPETFVGSVLVVKDGQPILNQGYGFADKNQGVANSFQSLYYIGSIQKSVTAVGIMKLVDEGKLTVDTPVSQFYPTLKNSNQMTIRQLLTHTSGIQGRTDKPTAIMNHQQVVEDIVQHTDVKEIGKWHYTNDNYSLLAGIIEKLSNQGYSEFIRDNVLVPAGLSHTGFYDTFKTALFHTEPYKKKETDLYQLNPISDASLSQEFGAGNMYMTTGDLYKFNEALISGKLVSEASLKEIQTPGNPTNGYGFGMYMQEGSKYSHGVLGSYNSLVLTSLDAKNAVVIMGNEKPDFDILKVCSEIYKELNADS